MNNEFRHCVNGHFYKGDKCPYCKVQTMLNDNTVEEPAHSRYLKICPNGHVYGSRLNYCPYCGETETCGISGLNYTLFLGSLKFVFDVETLVKINNNLEKKMVELEICYSVIRGYNSSYRIEGLSELNYGSIIQIGRQTFTGKEFIKWVDFMIGVKEIENHY